MKRKLILAILTLTAGSILAIWWFFIRDDAPPPPDIQSAVQIATAAQNTSATTAVPTPTIASTVPESTVPTTSLAQTTTTQLEQEESQETPDELELDEIGAITGTWMVDTTIGSFGIDESTSSFVGFRIKEVLARGIGEVTAVGRTPELDGSIEFEKGFLSRTEIVADLTKLRTDRSMRDSKVQSALNTNTHPNAVFVLEESIPITDNGSIESTASGFLTVNGLTNPVKADFQAQLVGSIMTVVGTFEVNLSDYEVEAPSAPVVVSVEDTAIVEFQLFFVEMTSEDSISEASVPTTTLDPLTIKNVEQLNEYIAEAASFNQADSDWLLPENLDPSAGGAPGFTRYVFRQTSAGVVPTLVEGPLGPQFRCQEERLPCSYLELKELSESNSPIPEEMGLSPEELASLVSELDSLREFLDEHADVNKACENGYLSDRIQTPNMGSHFIKADIFGNGFDPGEPEIILYALADGTLPNGAIGQCRDGVWDGEPMVLVGSAFILPPSEGDTSHPKGFTGDLDNWHVHLNLCRGRSNGTDTFVPKEECENSGGNFHETIGWMMHAWAHPEHDNELGVFSMWNPTIAPFGDSDTVEERFLVQGENFPEGAKQSLVSNFAFEETIEVEAGQSVYFNNSDSVPHTISAGTPDEPELEEFDSGILNPGDNFQIDTSKPGSYPLFCILHPDMTGLLIVN